MQKLKFEKYRFILLLLCSVIPTCLLAQQDSTIIFLESKGKWSLPMKTPDSVNTFTEYSKGWGCYWASIGFTSTESDSILAVFSGEILRVFELHGTYGIITRFGDFYIAYSNLRSVSVSEGEMVIQGACLGHADVNHDGKFSIDIQLKQKDKLRDLDPEFWFSNELDKIPRVPCKYPLK